MQTHLKKKYSLFMLDELQKRDDYNELKTDISKNRKQLTKWIPIIRSFDSTTLDQRRDLK